LTLLAPELFRIHALAGVRLEGEECNILREVRRSLKVDNQEESVAKAARELRKDKGRGTIKSAEWSEIDGLLMFRGKIYVSKDRDLRHRIVELPESHGYDAIMCVVDSLTKRAHFIPTHTTINAEGTALLFLKEVWKHHGTPRVVVSDRGPQFIAAFTRELYKLLGIKLAMLTAYHPQTDGQTERVNQVLEGYLRIFTS
jgi:transposase InsO family protein